jgi:transcriptional regulator with XRE-family HTH domain
MPTRRGRKKIASRLRELRERAGHTQDDLAALADVNVNTISRAENKSPVTWPTLNKLGNALRVHPQDLLGQPGVWSGGRAAIEDVAATCDWDRSVRSEIEEYWRRQHPEEA